MKKESRCLLLNVRDQRTIEKMAAGTIGSQKFSVILPSGDECQIELSMYRGFVNILNIPSGHNARVKLAVVVSTLGANSEEGARVSVGTSVSKCRSICGQAIIVWVKDKFYILTLNEDHELYSVYTALFKELCPEKGEEVASLR